MKELIERLENAEGPSRELDYEIFRATSGLTIDADDWIRGSDGKDRGHVRGRSERYTESIDSALTLLPDLTWLEIETGTQINGNHFNWPIIACGSQRTGNVFWKGQGATFAIALCIAALRAREALQRPPVRTGEE
jgi:hypothetical protein